MWVQRYNDPDNGEDRPLRLKVDDTGVYVLGTSWTHLKVDNGGLDYLLVKYDLNGARLWEYRYNHVEGDDDPVDMTLGGDGSIYVTGHSIEKPHTGPEFDILTLKISKDGKKLWEARYGAKNGMDDRSRAIGLDGRGNVYVVGTGRGLPGTLDQSRMGCITIKYDSNGHELWVRGTSVEEDHIEQVTAASVTEAGEVVACGTAHGPDGSPLARVIYRDANGFDRWSRDLCPLLDDDGLSAVCAVSGGVFLCGGVRPSGRDANFCTFEFDKGGELKWNKFLDSTFARGHGRAIIVKGAAVVVGQSSLKGDGHLAVVKYQP
jgi:hypothetical protein